MVRIAENYKKVLSSEDWLSFCVTSLICILAIVSNLISVALYGLSLETPLLLIGVLISLSYIGILYLNFKLYVSAARKWIVFNSLFWTYVMYLLLPRETKLEIFFFNLSILPFVVLPSREWKTGFVCFSLTLVVLLVGGNLPHPSFVEFSAKQVETLALFFAGVGFLSVIIPFLAILSLKSKIREQYAQDSLRLAQQKKLRSLGEISAGIAHEIANPLAIVSGRLQMGRDLLSRESLDIPKWKGWRRSIVTQLQRIKSVSAALEDLSRDHCSAASVCLKQLLDEILRDFSEEFKSRSIKATFLYDEGTHYIVRGEAHVFYRAIVNLILNAMDALEGASDRWVRFELAIKSDKVQMRVTDSGAGIDKEQAKNIFRPFYTTKSSGQGTGLGLPITKKYLMDFEATIQLNLASESTEFLLEFPNESVLTT